MKTYSAGWELAGGGRVLGCSGGAQRPCGDPYFEKMGPFFLRHVDMWWIGPMWPKCAFGDQKGLIWKKKHAIWESPLSWDQKLRTVKKNRFYLIAFYGPKSGILGQKTVFFGCFGPVEKSNIFHKIKKIEKSKVFLSILLSI